MGPLESEQPADTAELAQWLEQLSSRVSGYVEWLYPTAADPVFAERMLASSPSWQQVAPSARGHLGGQLHAALAAPVGQVINGSGRRWRSAMMLQTIDTLGGDSERFGLLVGAWEVAHAGSLVVDDVEDEAELRRGRQAAHHVFGIPVALNAGSAAYLTLHQAIEHCLPDEPALRDRVYRMFMGSLHAAHAGQALDLHGHHEELEQALAGGDSTLLLERVRLTHRLKSGAMEGAGLAIAAMVSGADDATVETLRALGTAVGTAYQITDDVADLHGVPRQGVATKVVGEDLRNGKVTMPLAHAVALLPVADLEQVWQQIRRGCHEAVVVGDIARRLEDCGALTACAHESHGLLDGAWHDLRPHLPAGRGMRMLRAMACHVVDNNFYL